MIYIQDILYKKYSELVSIIFAYGEYFPKKHGNYIKLKYIDDYSFCMDSWNKSITLVKDAEFNGDVFKGQKVYYLGIDFGGFECHVLEEQLDCWIENLKYELGKLDYDFSKLIVEWEGDVMEELFEIIKITDKDGTDRTDGRYPLRIGRRCKLHLYGCDIPALFEYVPRENEDYQGVLRTSCVEGLEITYGIHKITTMNSIYYLKESK